MDRDGEVTRMGYGNRFERDYFIKNKCFKNGLYNWEVSKLLNKLFSQVHLDPQLDYISRHSLQFGAVT